MDWRIVIKVAITAILIVAISEVGKRSSFFGAILASIPLTSLLALTWLYLDSKDLAKPAQMSMDIFWAVIPSLVFFPAFTWLLRSNLGFPVSMLFAIAVTAVAYLAFFSLVKQ
jgi:uncharacterized membrane protein (GlpM family)